MPTPRWRAFLKRAARSGRPCTTIRAGDASPSRTRRATSWASTSRPSKDPNRIRHGDRRWPSTGGSRRARRGRQPHRGRSGPWVIAIYLFGSAVLGGLPNRAISTSWWSSIDPRRAANAHLDRRPDGAVALGRATGSATSRGHRGRAAGDLAVAISAVDGAPVRRLVAQGVQRRRGAWMSANADLAIVLTSVQTRALRSMGRLRSTCSKPSLERTWNERAATSSPSYSRACGPTTPGTPC